MRGVDHYFRCSVGARLSDAWDMFVYDPDWTHHDVIQGSDLRNVTFVFPVKLNLPQRKPRPETEAYEGSEAVRCSGTNAAGERCRNETTHDSGACYAHRYGGAVCGDAGGLNADGSRCEFRVSHFSRCWAHRQPKCRDEGGKKGGPISFRLGEPMSPERTEEVVRAIVGFFAR